jgi:membrane protein
MQKPLHLAMRRFLVWRDGMIGKLWCHGKKIAAFLRPMHIPLHSAYTSFFLILSLFPSLLLLLGLLRYTELNSRDLLDFLQGWLPESLLPTVEALVQSSYRHSSSTVISVSVLAALWSASRGMYGLLRGLHGVYGEETAGGYWKKRVLSIAYTLSFLVVLVLTLLLHVFGNTILDYLWMMTNPVLMALMNVIDLRFVLLLGLQSSLFCAMYALLAGKRRSVFRCLPGALLASLGWLTFSRLFSVYVTHFSRYSNIFGSIYGLALGMLWLYFCISILFYGAAFNRWLEEN